jgi:hypothetical protein
MATLTQPCPICGTRLFRDTAFAIVGDTTRDGGDHVHLTTRVRATCLQGHEWGITGDLTLWRLGAGRTAQGDDPMRET